MKNAIDMLDLAQMISNEPNSIVWITLLLYSKISIFDLYRR